MTEQNKTAQKKINTWVKLSLELGPIILFFAG